MESPYLIGSGVNGSIVLVKYHQPVIASRKKTMAIAMILRFGGILVVAVLAGGFLGEVFFGALFLAEDSPDDDFLVVGIGVSSSISNTITLLSTITASTTSTSITSDSMTSASNTSPSKISASTTSPPSSSSGSSSSAGSASSTSAGNTVVLSSSRIRASSSSPISVFRSDNRDFALPEVLASPIPAATKRSMRTDFLPEIANP